MRRIVACGVAAALMAAAWSGDVKAQRPADTLDSCRAIGATTDTCLAAAVAADVLIGSLALGAVAGNPVPGTATTLGQRVGGGVKLAFYLRAQRAGGSMPDLTDPLFAQSDFGLTSVNTGVVAGLYEGSRIMSTVGGFLSVDAFAHASWIRLPGTPAFDRSPMALTVGTRIGILREGFTVPGIAISVSRTWMGAVGVAGTGLSVAVDPSVTALRATVGKDVGGFELLGGWGWDDRSGNVEFTTTTSSATGGSLEDGRALWFGSVARTFGIVLTLGAEAGRAGGAEAAAFSEGARWYGTVFGRLTL